MGFDMSTYEDRDYYIKCKICDKEIGYFQIDKNTIGCNCYKNTDKYRKDFDDLKIVKNTKTKELYHIINNNVINSTNSNDGERMVLYTKELLSSEGKYTELYVRSYNEFLEKFEKP